MKRYSFAITITALAFCLLLAGACLLLAARMRMGLESLVNTVGSGSPEAGEAFAKALIGTVPSAEEAQAGRSLIADMSYSSMPVDHFMGRVISDGFLCCLIGAALALIAAVALFLFFERRRRIRLEEDLTARIGSALRGESVFKPEHDDERDLARLFAEIGRVNALRESSANELREYLENAAHEIKSPTSGILLNLDLMERGGIDEAKLAAARKCAARIDSYTSSLLSLARLRAGKVRMNFEPADLGELARETAAELEANGVAVLISGERAEVSCDRVRIREVIKNLVVNASKHQPEDEPVRAEIGSDEREAFIRVIDSGPGIGDGALIERYAVGNEDGTSFGIGLSLAREIALRHSGRLIVKKPETGAEIELVIPRFKLKTSI